MPGDAGLGVDQGDVVGDDIVQVTGDAHALGGDPACGFVLAGAFGVLGAVVQRGQVGAP